MSIAARASRRRSRGGNQPGRCGRLRPSAAVAGGSVGAPRTRVRLGVEQDVADVDRADAVDHRVVGLGREHPAAVLETVDQRHLPQRARAVEPVRPEVAEPLVQLGLPARAPAASRGARGRAGRSPGPRSSPAAAGRARAARTGGSGSGAAARSARRAVRAADRVSAAHRSRAAARRSSAPPMCIIAPSSACSSSRKVASSGVRLRSDRCHGATIGIARRAARACNTARAARELPIRDPDSTTGAGGGERDYRRAVDDLRGANALLTGAAGGLGRHIAHALAAEGVRLALSGRHLEPLEQLCAELRPAGRQPSQCSPTSPISSRRPSWWSKPRRSIGPLDLLVNNAGIETAAAYPAFTDEELAAIDPASTWSPRWC